MRRLNNEKIKAIAKQIEDLLVEYPRAKELFNSKATTFKALFDKWKLASDNKPRPYSDSSGNNGKDGYEYDKDEQEWFPIQTPKLPPNPALWEIDDKLCCHYVTLGIIRDMIYADKAKPIVKDILQGKEAKTDAYSFILYFIENANHKVYFDDSIELALSQVKQDLAKKAAKQGQENEADKESPKKAEDIVSPPKHNWEDIYIEVIDGHNVKVKIDNQVYDKSFSDLGFADNRCNPKKPNRLWDMFLSLAEKSCGRRANAVDIKKHDIKRIRRTLESHFNINESPISDYLKGCWLCKFKFNDPRSY